MKQPLKNKSHTDGKKSVNKCNVHHKSTHRQKYGTSKLEADFAHEYLDRLGLKYIYEYEAKEIGRFYDFAVTVYDNVDFKKEKKNGIECLRQDGQNIPISFCIEVDGDWWHSNPKLVNEKKLNPTQKHNKFIDFLKDKWCESNGIPLLRIWEEDIRNHPDKVFEQLSQYITDGNRKKRIAEIKKKPH